MNYIIIESQTNGTTTSVLKTVKADYNEAEQQYHTVLAAAAVSNVEIHAATMLTENGKMVKYECYDHRQPEPVAEE